MALLRCFHRNVLILRNHTRLYADLPPWNQHWKPGPYPVTAGERAAAAKKYGLRPEEYEPYPDDGMGYGDYPKLPPVSAEARDPYYPWDYPEHKRNFMEPLHVDFDMMTEERYNMNMRHQISPTVKVLTFFGIFGGFAVLYYFLQDYKLFRPVLIKQYPREGVVHYTFEPAMGNSE